MEPISRRGVLSAGLAATVLVACDRARRVLPGEGRTGAENDEGRLRARPRTNPTGDPKTGSIELGLAEERDALLYVPPTYDAKRGAPLVIALHGAGGRAEVAFSAFRPYSDESGTIVLSPGSRAVTWDAALGGFGPDVAFIDRSLDYVFSRYRIDRRHIALQGFSDGASYALSLGLTNGDLFTHLVAFSPGFSSPATRRGKPRIFISHGTDDSVLPIDRTSRVLVPDLKKQGYDVRYEEFEGTHQWLREVAAEAFRWFIA